MTVQRYNALIAEYFERQLWQFVSIAEWLAAHKGETECGIASTKP